MRLRKLLEKEALIRLTVSGFVETIRYFGLPERCLTWETPVSESREESISDEGLVFARVPVRSDEIRRRTW